MSSFLKFIEEDIEAKKVLISTMPVNTKRDIKKFNEKVDTIERKYLEYKSSVKRYLNSKNKSFNLKTDKKNFEELNSKINALEHVRFILNPINTYFEKIGFDDLIYQISNYYDFNFNSLNEIIEEFLKKFELIGIKLSEKDFNTTCYVYEYMTSFLEARNKNKGNYDKVLEKFEKIYWVNPEIIGHIELNFRKLIDKYEKKFISYIDKLQKEVLVINKINNYEECLIKLKGIYSELEEAKKEKISDIIEYAKKGDFDINNYFEDSKIRMNAYSSLSIDPLDFNSKEIMDKFYDNLDKLKTNLEEYENYIKFTPLFDDFKNQYKKQLGENQELNKTNVSKNLKNIKSQISDKESKLDKINKKLFNKIGFSNSKIMSSVNTLELSKKIFSNIAVVFETKNNEEIKQLKIDSVKLAQELSELYKAYDKEYFNEKTLDILNVSLTVSELLNFYFNYDYFKKIAIKRVFEIHNYDEILNYSDSFDLFAMNLNNVIINGIILFDENNISRTIINKYRLDNINLNDENLNSNDLNPLLEKIQMLLRINEIDKSPMTIEKIWFMVQVEKINNKDTKTEENS